METKKVKVAHLTSVHRPFDIRIFYRECKTLFAEGCEVVLIAPHVHDDEREGIRIRAVPRPKGRAERMTRTVWQVYQAARLENAQVYHFHDPELIPIGLLLKLKGKRVIYDVHEDLPCQILGKYWIPRWLKRLTAKVAETVEGIGTKTFDGIIAATPAIAKHFPPQKTVVVQNFPVAGGLFPVEFCSYAERPPVVTYIGGITAVRGIKEMVQAMSLLPRALGAKLTIAGSFSPPELEGEVRCLSGWECVEFVGWQQRDGVARLLAQARAGLVLFHPLPNHVEAQPNKLFEYMAAGIPVVASDFPLWRGIVKESGCGVLADPLDPGAIAEAIRWLLEHPKDAEAMGKRGQEAIHAKYGWQEEAQKLTAFYRKIF
jgi:glycosyltransferase involved in cell wall biosynthesis